MLKIPELPIYNTERYTNFSPISPEDFVQGQIYTNDKLVIYIAHLSFNKTAGYLVWDNEGKYVGTKIDSSQNIYAIVTFLNNNNFRLLDYELEVINPYNTNEKILLTPNGTKKIKITNEMYARGKFAKLMENSIRRILKEGILNDIDTYNDEDEQELEPFEEYEKDYPNGDFDVSDMTPEKLAKWCQNVGDFLYVYEGLRGLSIMCANVDNIVASIVSDLYNCRGIEPTHEVDYLFYSREREFIYNYVCIFKVIGTPDGDYYVVYQEDKSSGRHPSIEENKKHINEAFKSNQLRQWFKEHGGVKKKYDEYDDTVPQDGLGDVNDNDILYTEEFGDFNSASNKMFNLKRSSYGKRSDWDMKCFFTIYKANDGACLLVGLDRKTVPTGITWGGEKTKKYAKRKWRDDKEPHNKNHYVDDRGTYYYGKKAQDFGLKRNQDFKGKQSDNKRIKSQMSDAEWKEYMNNRISHMQDYLNRHYPKKK